MRTDGLFDFRVVEYSFKQYNKPLSLYPISDIHRDSPNFAHQVWENTKQEISNDPNPKMFILLGDTLEAFSSSERRHVISTGFHDTTVKSWSNYYSEKVNNFVKEVKPIMGGKCLAVFGGNHYFEFKDGTTTDHAIAAGLNAPYIGTAGYVVLILKYCGSQSHAVKIFCHHGTSETKMKQARSNFRADLILMGHNHQMHATPLPDIDIAKGAGNNWNIIHHETRLVRTGSFLKTYEPGMSSYGVDAGYAPAMLGCPKILITPRRTGTSKRKNTTNGNEDRWVDIKAVV